MANLDTRWLIIDASSLEENGSGELQLKIVDPGAIERTANGINVKASGITNDMLAGDIALSKLADAANIALKNIPQTISGVWTFEAGSVPLIGTEHVTTKEYVDALLSGLDHKGECKALSTTNRDVSSGLPSSVDGVTGWADGDRILLNGQTDPKENGIWEVQSSGGWTRPADFATGDSVGSSFTFVQEGTTYADTGWVCSNDSGSDIVGTDDINFVQFSSAGVILPGNGLNQTGQTFNVVPLELVKGGNAEIAGNNLQVSYVPANYTPTVITGVTTTDQLGAHLKGIDDAISDVGHREVDRFVLTGTDLTNKYLTLSTQPKSPNRVDFRIKGAPTQDYGDDYVMSGTEPLRVTWDGLGLDGSLVIGDKVRIVYDS